MATRYAVGSGLWSDNADVWSDSDGGAAGDFVPADGDTVVISAAVNVQVDVDQSAWTGLLGMTVRGGATPGMVYWKDGQSGILRFRTGANVVGTNDTNNGRILANSDGVWATTTELTYATKEIIVLIGSAAIDCTLLDVRMRCDEPTNKYVRVYGTKYDFDYTDVSVANDTLDLGTTPPSAGTPVAVISTGDLPGGLETEFIYYVRSVSGNTCKLATQNEDAQIVNITSQGSGTISIYTGHTNTSTDTVNVLDDVTSDNWTVGDTVVLADVAPENYDQQHNITLLAINAGTIQLSANVDSAQFPLSKIWLSTRNCSILQFNTSTTQAIVGNGLGCIFGELRAASGTGITFYCYGIYQGDSHVVSVISGCFGGIYTGTGHTATTIIGCNYGIHTGTGHTVTTIAGSSYALYGTGGLSHLITTIVGSSYAVYFGLRLSINTIYGCNTALYNAKNTKVTTIKSSITGINSANHTRITTISGCNTALNSVFACEVDHIIGCSYGISQSQCSVKNMSKNLYDCSNSVEITAKGGVIPSAVTWAYQNVDGNAGHLYSENHAGVLNAQKIFQMYGDATKVTAGAGSPTPDQRSGGNAYLIELSNLQSNLNSENEVIAWKPESVRIWAAASTSKTYRFYVQSTFALTADEITLKATYMDSGADTDFATVESDETISARSGITDWSQYLEVTINPGQTGWIYFELELYKYSAGGQVFIDPLVVIS